MSLSFLWNDLTRQLLLQNFCQVFLTINSLLHNSQQRMTSSLSGFICVVCVLFLHLAQQYTCHGLVFTNSDPHVGQTALSL